jgi:hypothetical protein
MIRRFAANPSGRRLAAPFSHIAGAMLESNLEPGDHESAGDAPYYHQSYFPASQRSRAHPQ